MKRPTTYCPSGRFCAPVGQSAVSSGWNHNYKCRRPARQRGALAIVTNVGTGCGGRGSVRRTFLRDE